MVGEENKFDHIATGHSPAECSDDLRVNAIAPVTKQGEGNSAMRCGVRQDKHHGDNLAVKQ